MSSYTIYDYLHVYAYTYLATYSLLRMLATIYPYNCILSATDIQESMVIKQLNETSLRYPPGEGWLY